MKKISQITIIASVIMMLASLSSCTKTNSEILVGNWAVTEYSNDEGTFSADSTYLYVINFTVDKDYTAKMWKPSDDMVVEPVVRRGTYSLDGDKLKLSYSSHNNVLVVESMDELTMKLRGRLTDDASTDETYTLVKLQHGYLSSYYDNDRSAYPMLIQGDWTADGDIYGDIATQPFYVGRRLHFNQDNNCRIEGYNGIRTASYHVAGNQLTIRYNNEEATLTIDSLSDTYLRFSDRTRTPIQSYQYAR